LVVYAQKALRIRHYTLFVNKPELRKQQLDARSLWWDREQDLKEQAELDKSKIKKKPYEYY